MFYENIPAQVLMDMTQILQRALMKGMSTQMHAQAEIIVKSSAPCSQRARKSFILPSRSRLLATLAAYSQCGFSLTTLSLAATRLVHGPCSIFNKLGNAWR